MSKLANAPFGISLLQIPGQRNDRNALGIQLLGLGPDGGAIPIDEIGPRLSIAEQSESGGIKLVDESLSIEPCGKVTWRAVFVVEENGKPVADQFIVQRVIFRWKIYDCKTGQMSTRPGTRVKDYQYEELFKSGKDGRTDVPAGSDSSYDNPNFAAQSKDDLSKGTPPDSPDKTFTTGPDTISTSGYPNTWGWLWILAELYLSKKAPYRFRGKKTPSSFKAPSTPSVLLEGKDIPAMEMDDEESGTKLTGPVITRRIYTEWDCCPEDPTTWKWSGESQSFDHDSGVVRDWGIAGSEGKEKLPEKPDIVSGTKQSGSLASGIDVVKSASPPKKQEDVQGGSRKHQPGEPFKK